MVRNISEELRAFEAIVKIVQNESVGIIGEEFGEVFQVGALSENNAKQPFTEQITVVLISGPNTKILFKIHHWLGKTGKKENVFSQRERNLSKDHYKEICNIIAGRIGGYLMELGCIVGQSLPVSLDGFNQVFFNRQRRNEHSVWWSLDSKVTHLMCSLNVIFHLDADVKVLLSEPHSKVKLNKIEIFNK